MKIKSLPIKESYLIEPSIFSDERGSFFRVFCEKIFKKEKLCSFYKQTNSSFNNYQGTIRGMHYQEEPYSEIKLVRCTKGSIFDVLIDLRPASPTYKQWYGTVLSDKNSYMLYIPQGCAHGYQTLEDDSELFYFVSEFYTPESEKGIAWNDPLINISWPLNPTHISKKDQSHPFLTV